MALIKCEECGHEVSDHAKLCPNCGYQNNNIICPECGTIIYNDDECCSNYGYVLNMRQNNNVTLVNRGKNHALAVFALILSFFLPIISLTLAVSVSSSNNNEKNDANTLAIVAAIISLLRIAVVIIYIILTFFPKGI